MKKSYLIKIILIALIAILAIVIFRGENKLPSSRTSQSTSEQNSSGFCFEKATQLQTAAKFDSANIYFEKAFTYFFNERKWEDAIECLCSMSENFVKMGLYEKAMTQVQHAKEIADTTLSTTHPAIANIFNSRGNIHRKKGELKLAEDDFNHAIYVSTESGLNQSIEIAASFHGLGVINYFYGKLETSLEFHQKALSIRLKTVGEQHPSVADSYVNLGIISLKRGDFNKTLHYYQKALDIRLNTLGDNHTDVSNSHLNLGVLYFRKGDYEKAIESFEKSVSIVQGTAGVNHPSLAGSYLNLGTIWLRKGNLEKSLVYFQKSLSLTLAVIGENHPLVALNYNNLGVIFKNRSEYDTALEYYNKALNTHLRISRSSTADIARCYLNIANIFSLKKKFDQALEYYHKALSIARKIKQGDETLVAIIYNNIGIAYADQKDYSRALQFFTKSLEESRGLFGESHPLIAETCQQIADVYIKQKNYKTALAFLQDALIALLPDFKNKSIYSNPDLKNINEENRLLQILAIKASTLKELFFADTTLIRNLESAVSTFEVASHLIDAMRIGYKSESVKLDFGEDVHEIYSKAIQTCFLLYQLTNQDSLKEKAFGFVEKMKFATLHQTIMESKAKKFAGIPDSLLDYERQLKIDLSFLDKQLFEESKKSKKADSAKISLWQNSLFQLKRDYESLINRFEKSYPAYFNLKYQTGSPSVTEIQEKVLISDSAILEYFLSDSSLFIFTMTKNQFEITEVPKDDKFNDLLKQIRTGLMDRIYSKYTSAAYQLYLLLIEPVEPMIRGCSLIIIPHGPMGYIPFETLLSRPAENKFEDYSNLAYLIHKHQISYSYSSALLLENCTVANEKSSGQYLGFAPIFFQKQ